MCLVNVFGEGIVEIQWSGNFQTLYTIATKHKHFGNKIYKHDDVTGYTRSTVSYSTQNANDELMMHTINCSNRIYIPCESVNVYTVYDSM